MPSRFLKQTRVHHHGTEWSHGNTLEFTIPAMSYPQDSFLDKRWFSWALLASCNNKFFHHLPSFVRSFIHHSKNTYNVSTVYWALTGNQRYKKKSNIISLQGDCSLWVTAVSQPIWAIVLVIVIFCSLSVI